MSNIGGIELNNIIIFQTQLMMGAQYGKLQEAQKEAKKSCDDACKILVQTCLRLAWNDAFRHVTENQEKLEKRFKKNGDLHGYKNLDTYIYATILSNNSNNIVIDTFTKYINTTTTNGKVNVLVDANTSLVEIFGSVKVIDEKKSPKRALCFGHFQKLYNMAVKYYICLYMLRDILGLKFMNDSVLYADPAYFEYADCPIDNYILKRLGENCQASQKDLQKKYGHNKFEKIVWSQLKDKDDIELYKSLQDTIRTFLESDQNTKGKCNLYFDFAFWK